MRTQVEKKLLNNLTKLRKARMKIEMKESLN